MNNFFGDEERKAREVKPTVEIPPKLERKLRKKENRAKRKRKDEKMIELACSHCIGVFACVQ